MPRRGKPTAQHDLAAPVGSHLHELNSPGGSRGAHGGRQLARPAHQLVAGGGGSCQRGDVEPVRGGEEKLVLG